jgi:hypothetical protein
MFERAELAKKLRKAGAPTELIVCAANGELPIAKARRAVAIWTGTESEAKPAAKKQALTQRDIENIIARADRQLAEIRAERGERPAEPPPGLTREQHAALERMSARYGMGVSRGPDGVPRYGIVAEQHRPAPAREPKGPPRPFTSTTQQQREMDLRMGLPVRGPAVRMEGNSQVFTVTLEE